MTSVAFSPDSKCLVSGGGGGYDRQGEPLPTQLKVWDVARGQEVRTFKAHTGLGGHVTYSPDGKRIATTGGEVRVIDAESGQELLCLKGHIDVVIQVAYSPDGKRFATAGGTARRGCGTPKRARSCSPSTGTPTACPAWPSTPTANS